MARAEAPCAFQTILVANCPTNRQGRPTPECTEQNSHRFFSVFACKLKDFANSGGSYPLANMETSDNTLDLVYYH